MQIKQPIIMQIMISLTLNHWLKTSNKYTTIIINAKTNTRTTANYFLEYFSPISQLLYYYWKYNKTTTKYMTGTINGPRNFICKRPSIIRSFVRRVAVPFFLFVVNALVLIRNWPIGREKLLIFGKLYNKQTGKFARH